MQVVIFIGGIMYKFFIVTIVLFCNIYFAQSNIDSKASKMFFMNEEFGAIVTGENEIMFTNNGCDNWTTVKIETQERLDKIYFSSMNIGWIIGDSSVYKTLDGGFTWNKNFTFRASQLHTLFFTNENVGFVGGEDYNGESVEMVLYNTTNCGNTWEKSIVDSVLENGILDFSFIHDSIGIAVGYNTLYKTYDFGKNWNKLPINFSVGGFTPEGVHIIDTNNILLFGGVPNVVWNGEIYMSDDGGLSLKEYGNGQTFEWGIKDYFVYNRDSVWITNGTNIFKTTNQGNNWEIININVEEFSFFSNKRAYGLSENRILYTDNGWETYTIVDSVLVGVEQNEGINYSYKLFQNYPNPFNSSTTIRFEIPNREKVRITLYNLTGELINELFDDELNVGAHEIYFNASNLSSGVYLYQIKTSNYVGTKKCILLK